MENVVYFILCCAQKVPFRVCLYNIHCFHYGNMGFLHYTGSETSIVGGEKKENIHIRYCFCLCCIQFRVYIHSTLLKAVR